MRIFYSCQFFHHKITVDLIYLLLNFNKTLTNDVVYFKQPAPDVSNTNSYAFVNCASGLEICSGTYHYDQKFLDRQAYANSADPDQTAPRGAG